MPSLLIFHEFHKLFGMLHFLLSRFQSILRHEVQDNGRVYSIDINVDTSRLYLSRSFAWPVSNMSISKYDICVGAPSQHYFVYSMLFIYVHVLLATAKVKHVWYLYKCNQIKYSCCDVLFRYSICNTSA